MLRLIIAPFRTLLILCLLLALVSCSSDEDMGPVAPPVVGVPLPVTDLIATAGSASSVTLKWTTPGLGEKAEKPVHYDVRYTRLGTEDQPWDGWNVATAPDPSTHAGQVRFFVVRNLPEGVALVFRMKASVDGVSWSGRSNLVVATANPDFDQTAPARITDLHHRSGNDTEMLVAWTAAGNDSIYGEATGYIVRYARTPIDAVSWNDATRVTAAVVPVAGTRSYGVTLTDLEAGVDYYVGVTAHDGSANIAPLSNVLQATTGQKKTIYVNVEGTGDYPTIEAAVDAARPGDLVLVGPGRYTWSQQGTGHPTSGMINVQRDITGEHSDYTLRSEMGAAATILDGEEQGPVMTITGGTWDPPGGERQWAGITVDGFTFTNGKAVDAEASGAAMSGAGMSIHLSDSVIRNCVFVENTALQGGGVWIGGQGAVVMENCLIANNHGTVGGGMFIANSEPRVTVRDCVIRNNRSIELGGGVFTMNVLLTMEDCLVVGNISLDKGGGFYCLNVKDGMEIIGTTIAGNEGPWGAAIRIWDPGLLKLTRCLVAFNSGGSAFSAHFEAGLAMGCSNVFGNPAGDDPPAIFTDLGGNFSRNPLFCDGDDYTLKPSSPCLPNQHPEGADCGLVGARGAGVGCAF